MPIFIFLGFQIRCLTRKRPSEVQPNGQKPEPTIPSDPLLILQNLWRPHFPLNSTSSKRPCRTSVERQIKLATLKRCSSTSTFRRTSPEIRSSWTRKPPSAATLRCPPAGCSTTTAAATAATFRPRCRGRLLPECRLPLNGKYLSTTTCSCRTTRRWPSRPRPRSPAPNGLCLRWGRSALCPPSK